ncbi:MAG: site-2 protease family protein [Anaerolineaceae bacterium]|nr:site-2 protease family protein [Anaerolineaceae bacterium]
MDQSNYSGMDNIENQIINTIQKYFAIIEFTIGTGKDTWKYRFRGSLKNQDSETFFDYLEKNLSIYDLHPLLRLEKNQPVLYLVQKIPQPLPSNPKINLILFILTFLSVWFTGGLLSLDSLDGGFTLETVKVILFEGWPFAISIIAILGAHEMGHYFAGRYHKVNVTLPYFIPLPIISPFGTMGAFINMKNIPKNRKHLFDIGIAGPLSGLIVAIPVLIVGLLLSKIEPLPASIANGVGLQMEGNSLLYLVLKYLVFGEILPQPVSYAGVSPIIYWLKYFFTGQPFPFGGMDVMIHPVAWAGWAGLFVTCMNLIPIGQLDGGHILASVIGEKSRRIYNVMLFLMIILGFAWNGWWFWAVILFFLNRAPSQVYDEITILDQKRKMIAVLMLIIFILVFIPVPLIFAG